MWLATVMYRGRTLEFVKATHAGEKVDSWKKASGDVVWPSEDELEEAPEIGYGHFPEDLN